MSEDLHVPAPRLSDPALEPGATPELDAAVARKAARAEVSRRAMVLVLALLMIAVSLVLGQTFVLIKEVRSTQVNGSPIIQRVEKLAADIRDCTDTSGTCYRRQQADRAETVRQINEITLYAAACAARQDNPTYDQLKGCVARLYRANHPDDELAPILTP